MERISNELLRDLCAAWCGNDDSRWTYLALCELRDRRAADLNESERAELARLRAENADLQKTIDEQSDDINTLAEERQRLRAVVDRLGDAEMVVPCYWINRDNYSVLRGKNNCFVLALNKNSDGTLEDFERIYGVIRLRDGAGEKAS